jgi:hypothetical protein
MKSAFVIIAFCLSFPAAMRAGAQVTNSPSATPMPMPTETQPVQEVIESQVTQSEAIENATATALETVETTVAIVESGKSAAPASAVLPAEASGADPLDPAKEFPEIPGQAGPAEPAVPAAAENTKKTEPAPTPAPISAPGVTATPMGNIVVNLINKLVERGVIGPDDAKAMITQAQAEAETQKAQNESDMFAIAQIAAVQTMTDQAVAQQASMSPLEASRREMEADMRVTHIPAPVREQITEEIRRELAGKIGGGENQPPPGLPALLAKLRPEGEIRFRYEADLYPSDNFAGDNAFVNFNSINTGSPINILPSALALNPPPQWNTDQNRNRYRMLVRLGTGIELGDNVTAGVRLASGDNNSPTTANQSLGLANQGQGGQFSKYAIWIERAFIRYDLGGGTNDGALALWVGRFDNPFFSTPIIFDNDLGFDGAALRASYNYEDVIIPSLVAGAFPVFNTDLNFSSNQPQKYPSYDKYLFAIQGGTQVNITRNWSTQLAAAYYYFYNIEGKLSSPYVQYSQSDAGDTDNSRPSFAQKGNTYRTLRNVIPPPGSTALLMDYQYFGLATPFQNLAFTGKLNYDGFDPVRVSLVGEFVRNVAFDSSAINEVAVNNLGTNGEYEGDPNAWLVDLEVGHAELDKLGAWQFSFGYRWIGSDAVVDGFNDSDFGLGGTNMKGFTVAARMALTPHLYMGFRWFGSESIAGPQFDMNIFQVDLGAKF